MLGCVHPIDNNHIKGGGDKTHDFSDLYIAHLNLSSHHVLTAVVPSVGVQSLAVITVPLMVARVPMMRRMRRMRVMRMPRCRVTRVSASSEVQSAAPGPPTLIGNLQKIICESKKYL